MRPVPRPSVAPCGCVGVEERARTRRAPDSYWRSTHVGYQHHHHGPVSGRDELRTVALSAIEIRDGFNPRERFDDRDLERLAASIARRGLLQPLVVTAGEQPGSYQLIAGERRYRACFAVGLTEVPVLVRPPRCEDDVDGALIDAVVENLHRSDHTPLEEATAFAAAASGGTDAQGDLRAALGHPRARARPPAATGGATRAASARSTRGRSRSPRSPHSSSSPRSIPTCPHAPTGGSRQPPEQSWQRPTSWADVAADPIGAVTSRYAGEHAAAARRRLRSRRELPARELPAQRESAARPGTPRRARRGVGGGGAGADDHARRWSSTPAR